MSKTPQPFPPLADPEPAHTEPAWLPKVRLVPEMETLFEDARAIAASKLADLRRQAEEKGVSGAELGQLKKAVEVLVALSKEERERNKGEQVTNLSDEELAELARLRKPIQESEEHDQEPSARQTKQNAHRP